MEALLSRASLRHDMMMAQNVQHIVGLKHNPPLFVNHTSSALIKSLNLEKR